MLIGDLKAAAAEGRSDEAAAGLRSALLPDLDYSSAQASLRFYQSLKKSRGESSPQVRMAVLGGYYTATLAPLIELYLFGANLQAEIYEADFGTFRQEILEPRSRLYSLRPGIVFLATGWHDARYLPGVGATAPEVSELCRRELADWLKLWETLHEKLSCTIIQNSFDAPTWRILANHDSRHPAGLARYLARLNLSFQEQAPSYVIIHDADQLAALRGRLAWNDARYYHYGKLPCAPAFLPDYAHSVASLVAAQLGQSKKCLVLDLDNTLWGGVAVEEGIEGIRLGQGDPEAEAFAAFQRYVKGLRDRGVILAVCSKNEDSIVKEVFEKHSEMVLRLSDFSSFKANWNDKVSNLRAIAQQLNLGLDSLVFVDDEPRERALVRRMIPEVAVPEMPEDPAEYIQLLEKYRYFQMVSLAEEDLGRADYYRANAAREAAASSAENLDSFLKSLNMRARVGPITASTIERCAQLINRSNQFNLTTRRYSAVEVRARMESPEWLTLTVSLSDSFGESGLVSCLLASIRGTELLIDTWVMSCRVIKRTVEQFLANQLYAAAWNKGLRTIRGEYIPTPKNLLVRDHFKEMGFSMEGSGQNGHTHWVLHLANDRPSLPTFVQLEGIA